MENMTGLIISHTHWDREWYQDYQGYRYRLVRMMDDLLDSMDKYEDFTYFHLDGQTIVLQDYLEIRPENEQRLRKYIEQGRIIIGPWYVMPDEFLISGEALIKNLQKGFDICKAYHTEPMKNGYVTDIFGHNSQFPQILNGFGIYDAVLYRGISDYPKDAFKWSSPDGSSVIAAKLDCERSYSNFYFTLRWAYEQTEFNFEDATQRLKNLIDYMKPSATSDMLLLMDGCDHLDAEPELTEKLTMFEKEISGLKLKYATLQEYFDNLRKQNIALETIEGPLYHIAQKGGNSQLLKNVLSSMVILKQQNDRCESLLTFYAEPLNAFTTMWQEQFLAGDRNTYSAMPRGAYLNQAWDYLLQNQPHDSICGCSVSEVHRDNEYRFRQSQQISKLMIEDSLAQLALNIRGDCRGKAGNILLYNPTQTEQNGIVYTTLLLPTGHTNNLRFYDEQGNELDVEELDYSMEYYHNHRLRKLITTDTMERKTVVIKNLTIPSFGYTVISYDDLRDVGIENFGYACTLIHPRKRIHGSLMTSHNSLDNGKFTLTVNENGSLNLKDNTTQKMYHNLLSFADDGDGGDGWNYRKPQFDSVVTSGGNFTFSVEADGPLACVWKITHHLNIPAQMASAIRRDMKNMISIEITTTITIVKDSNIIRFKTSLDNKCRHHRLRVKFPTEIQTDNFYTKTPFAMSKWDVKAEDNVEGKEVDTFVHPSQGVTYLSDGFDSVSVYSNGLYEVEVTDNKERAVVLTLFRSPACETGTCTPDFTQLLCPLSFDYAFSVGDKNPSQALLQGEMVRNPVYPYFFKPNQTGTLEQKQSFASLSSYQAMISHISQSTLGDGRKATVYRVVECGGIAQKAMLTIASTVSEAYRVDLNNNLIEKATFSENTVEINMLPYQIVSVAILI